MHRYAVISLAVAVLSYSPSVRAACELARITSLRVGPPAANGVRQIYVGYEFGEGNNGVTLSTSISGCGNSWNLGAHATSGTVSMGCTFACSANASYQISAEAKSGAFGCETVDTKTITLTLPEESGSVTLNNYRDVFGQIRLFGTYTLHGGTAASQLVLQQMPTAGENGSNITGAPIDIPLSSPGGAFDVPFTPATNAHHFEVVATLTSCGTVARASTLIDCDSCPAQSADPVWYVDGTTRYTDTDPLPRQLDTIALTRIYDTYHRFRSYFGRGWWSFLDARLTVLTSSLGDRIAMTTDSGDAVVFLSKNGLYTQLAPLASIPGSLKYESTAAQYVYRPSGRGTALLYRASDGRFVGFRDVATGREMQVSWNGAGLPAAVTDSWTGLTWSLTTDSLKRRITAVTVDTLTWNYEYDAGDNLQRVAAPGGATWRTYEQLADRLTTVRDGDGNMIETHAYNSAGAAISSTGPGDEIASIEYARPGAGGHDTITRVTANTGMTTDYLLRPVAGTYRPVQVTGGCTSCGTNDATYVYDERGHVTLQQDARGYVSRSQYDPLTGALVVRSTHLQPSTCDPAVSPDRCRMSSEQLSAAALVTTRGTLTTRYAYTDANWPERPTSISIDSLVSAPPPQSERRETFSYALNGEVLSHSVSGWSGGVYSTRTTTTTLYDGVAGAAFNPGGTAFDSQWLSLPQPLGRRKSIDGPRTDVSDVTQLVYYPLNNAVPATLRGHLAAVKNAAGHITRYEQYDVFGNLTRIVDPNGVATELTFDFLGRPLATTLKASAGCNTTADPLCATDLTTIRTYAGAGALRSEQRAGGGVTQYEYDARGRLLAMVRGPSLADKREKLEYAFDAATGKKSVERAFAREDGLWVEKKNEGFAYDAFSRLATVTHPDGTSTSNTYDAGNLTTGVRDENHGSTNTKYSYDPAGRLEKVEQLLDGIWLSTAYAYDAHGNLATVTDPNGNVTSYLFDDFVQMVTQQSPVTGTTQYAYDAAGNLTTATDANGAQTQRTFDALNRVTSATSTRGTAVETVTWSYDDLQTGGFTVGRLSLMTDPAGATHFSYDRRGLLLNESRTFNGALYQYVTAFQYDRDGNRSLIGYPSTQLTVTYNYDYAGRPVSASGVISAAEYLPFGPLRKLVFANGTSQTLAYDARYRLSRNTLAGAASALVDQQYHTDGVGNVTLIEDLLDHGYDRTFSYDGLNRLMTATSQALWGADAYTWDAMGNIRSMRRGEITPTDEGDPPGDGYLRLRTNGLWKVFGRTTTFDYVDATPRLRTVTANDLEHGVTYDAAGNETAYLATRTYSPRNLLQEVADDAEPEEPLRHRVTYGYDGRGVRVTRGESPANEGSGTARRYYIYSPELRLLSVTRDDSPNVWAMSGADRDVNYELVWFGDRPVAQVPTAGPRVYTFADHLGTPILQTDATGTVTWHADYEPFGNVYSMRAGNRLDQPLRFPGQEVATNGEGFEENYNIFRWYRAGWGRYVTADPTGLDGGINVYGYANANPVGNIDPLGLAPDAKCCVGFSSMLPGQEIGGVGVTLKHKLGGGPANTLRFGIDCPPDKPVLKQVGLESDGPKPESPQEHPFPNGWDRKWKMVWYPNKYEIDVSVPTRTWFFDRPSLKRIRVSVACCNF